MEFWGAEVKSGECLRVEPGEGYIVHISQMALGKKEKNETESVRMFLNVGEQKLVIGTLSHEQFPQLSTEIVVNRGFQLSHTRKKGSIFFTGYKVDASEEETEDKCEPVAVENSVAARSDGRQVNFHLPYEGAKQDDDEDSEEDSDDDTSSEESEDEKEKKVAVEAESEDSDEDDSADDDEDDSSDEETPKKAVEESKKRPAEATTSKGSTSNKKAKFVTPQKTESKKPHVHVHVATPHPSKGGKSSGSNGEASEQQQTPKSAGTFGCNSCNRKFTSEMGLQSHTKAKHSAPA